MWPHCPENRLNCHDCHEDRKIILPGLGVIGSAGQRQWQTFYWIFLLNISSQTVLEAVKYNMWTPVYVIISRMVLYTDICKAKVNYLPVQECTPIISLPSYWHHYMNSLLNELLLINFVAANYLYHLISAKLTYWFEK